MAFDWKNTGDYGSVADYRHYSAPPTFFGRGLFLLEIYHRYYVYNIYGSTEEETAIARAVSACVCATYVHC